MAKERQRCNRCQKAKPLSAFRRFAHRKSGYDSICKACHKARYEAVKAGSFGPLPEPEGSKAWLAEIRRRAKVIRDERGVRG